jgi:hypothetical protein
MPLHGFFVHRKRRVVVDRLTGERISAAASLVVLASVRVLTFLSLSEFSSQDVFDD